jgi:porin
MRNWLAPANGSFFLGLLAATSLTPCAYAQTSDSASTGSIAVPAQVADTESTSMDHQDSTTSTAEAANGLWTRSTLLGDIGGLRTLLGNHGVTVSLQETSEYLGNVSGGIQRGGAYDGLTELGLVLDTQKAFGLAGGTFNVSALQIHGTNLTQRNLLELQNASGIEADSGTRLWELWYQQSFAHDAFDIRIGQQSLDQEFLTSANAAYFINATFGWPVLPSIDLPAGGPAYPLSSLGIRARAKVGDAVTVLAGVVDGDPAGEGTGDPQALNAHGTNFDLGGNGALAIGEVQYAINPPSGDASDTRSTGLPGTYKLGFWYHTGHFVDPRSDNAGMSLAGGAGSDVAPQYHGNYSLYAVADQMIWRPSADSPQSLSVFARATGAPGDRNVVDLGINAGITLKAPFKQRDNDVAGIAVGYAKISSHAQDVAEGFTSTVPDFPSRTAETVVEATYACQIVTWWMVQADFQYTFRPSGGIPNPQMPSQRVGNEMVIGLRTVITL